MREEGSSILEVLIAVMVLALAGTVLVGGLYMSRVVTTHTTVKRAVMAQLAAAAQDIKSQPFLPCSTTTDFVYATPTPKPVDDVVLQNVTITVEILDATTNQWNKCSENQTSPQHGIQKVTISAQANQEILKQVVLKTRG